MGLLERIDSPSDLRALSVEQLPELCAEIRAYMLEVLSGCPGHLGSSLGAVELCVALHYVFNTPDDRLVWDVGHQAYVHKILTGRREWFRTLRQMGGMRPFPTPLESEYDTATCGHASNSISLALGMSVAAKREGSERKIVAVIGDGAMSGGLAFEALNNVGSTANDMLIVLNDNDMSISDSVGGMKDALHRLHTGSTYNKLRYTLSQALEKLGLLGETRKKSILRFNNAMKSILFGQQNIFEGLDIRYFGPENGNDVVSLVRTLRKIKDMKGPKLLHLCTTKGKGYEAAEKDAQTWHAPGKFDVKTGQRLSGDETARPPRFQDVFGQTLLELARQNECIVGVTPAMANGSGLDIVSHEMADRTFDVGIAEGHALTFSAGMAKDGLQPFCVVYSSFVQRAYDNIIHDIAILGLPVVICLDRAGLVGEDGPTHHGLFDIAALRPIPNLTIASPLDECELRNLMFTAQQTGRGVFVIRYPRGRGSRLDWHNEPETIEPGSGRRLKEGNDTAVLSLGPIGVVVRKAIEIAESRNPGLSIGHYDLRFVKPIDEQLLREAAERYSRIITIEDGVREGGVGSAVLEWLADNGFSNEVVRLGLPDEFVEHGAVEQLYKKVGLDAESIARVLSKKE